MPASCSNGPRCSAITTARRASRWKTALAAGPRRAVRHRLAGHAAAAREDARRSWSRVFVLPPSADELKARLERRAEDSSEVIAQRLENAVDEIRHWRGIRLRPGQPRSRQELRASARDPRRRAAQAREDARSRAFRRPAAGRPEEPQGRIRRRSVAALHLSAQSRAPARQSLRPGSPRRARSARCRRRRAARAASTPSDFRLWRSILRRWPKAASVTRCSAPANRRAAARPRHQPHHRRGDLRRRHEGRRRHVEQDLGLGAPAGEHRRAGRRSSSPGAATMRSATSRWNISISLSYQGGQGSAVSQSTSSAVRDIVGQVGDDAGAARRRARRADRRRAHRRRRSSSRPG